MTNLSIGKRLALGFALMLLLAMSITTIGIWRLQASANATWEMMDIPLAKERLINDWYNNVNAGVRRTTAIAKSSDLRKGYIAARDEITRLKKLGQADEAAALLDRQATPAAKAYLEPCSICRHISAMPSTSRLSRSTN